MATRPTSTVSAVWAHYVYTFLPIIFMMMSLSTAQTDDYADKCTGGNCYDCLLMNYACNWDTGRDFCYNGGYSSRYNISGEYLRNYKYCPDYIAQQKKDAARDLILGLTLPFAGICFCCCFGWLVYLVSARCKCFDAQGPTFRGVTTTQGGPSGLREYRRSDKEPNGQQQQEDEPPVYVPQQEQHVQAPPQQQDQSHVIYVPAGTKVVYLPKDQLQDQDQNQNQADVSDEGAFPQPATTLQ